MDFDDVETVGELVRHVWDVGALLALREQRLRYSEIGDRLSEWSGHRPGDSVLTRSLERLKRANLITTEGPDRTRRRYIITSTGSEHIDRVSTLVGALRINR